MKVSVEINEKKVKVVLTPTNEFERKVIEDIDSSKYQIITNVTSDYSYGNRDNYKLVLDLDETKE